MRTSTQKTDEIQPSTIAEAVRLEDHSHEQAPSVLESSRRASEIVTAAGNHLPNLVEMTNDLDNINSQIHYWTKVLDDARAEVSGASAKIRTAQTVLLETQDSKRAEDRRDRENAEYTLEVIEPRLKFQERRVQNAGTQIRTWKDRLKNFDRERFAKLKAADKKRDGLLTSPGSTIRATPFGI